jgi:hypothetical protein
VVAVSRVDVVPCWVERDGAAQPMSHVTEAKAKAR